MITRGLISNRTIPTAAFLMFMVMFITAGNLHAQQADSITETQKSAAVDSISNALIESYIFLDTAEDVRDHLQTRLRDGAYDDLATPLSFTRQLTTDMQSISHDLHLRVYVQRPLPTDPSERPDPEEQARQQLEGMRRVNFAFQEVEILPGNIGYLKFNGFVEAAIAGPTAVAAMNFLANTDALIIDLRDNGGGAPSMIQLLSSYFFEEPVHLNDFYTRQTDEWEQSWTQAHVEGPRMTDVPIFILTSGRTFSAAEEFTYNLKQLERATIVGETTRGGAHPVTSRIFQCEGLTIRITIPFSRAVNPINGMNWEGTGIEPHISVPAEDALERAIEEARRVIGGAR